MCFNGRTTFLLFVFLNVYYMCEFPTELESFSRFHMLCGLFGLFQKKTELALSLRLMHTVRADPVERWKLGIHSVGLHSCIFSLLVLDLSIASHANKPKPFFLALLSFASFSPLCRQHFCISDFFFCLSALKLYWTSVPFVFQTLILGAV